jgi:hypothetical protein
LAWRIVDYGRHAAGLVSWRCPSTSSAKKEEARVTLSWLRAILQQPPWANDTEAQSFRRKAEDLIEGKAGDKKP